jgi:hypothetical protein
MSEREGGNLSAQTANSLPYLHRLYQFPWHHSLRNRKLHQHRCDNDCFNVPTLQWALSWDIQQWARRRFGRWLCSRIQGTGCHDTKHTCYKPRLTSFKKNRLLRSLYYAYHHFSFRNRGLIFTKLGMTTCQLENTLIPYFSTSYNHKQQQQSRRANLWDGSDTIATYVTNDTESVYSNSLQNK